MNVIIFGASGGTGLKLCEQAQSLGYSVSAFVRKPEAFKLAGELNMIQGDVGNPQQVAAAIAGHDAVICAVGTPPSDKSKLRTRAVENIIAGMEMHGVKRLIVQSGLGCGESRALLPFHYKYLIFPLILKHVYADHEQQEQRVRASNLDWTIVRPAALTDGDLTEVYWHDCKERERPITVKISRADTAHFMLQQLVNTYYWRKAPNLSYA
ncbi:MAG: putative NADH-flavin reductase [Flavobacteriales bacterium]|jgi:putative NADH-flavin reductase